MHDKNSLYKAIIEKIPAEKVKIDEPMKNHTSFRIGGPADILVIPSSTEELKAVLQICMKNEIVPYIIGNGTNLLVLDNGIRGVVIKISSNFNYVEFKGSKVITHAGVLLSALSRLAMEQSLTGLEFAGGIPGTVGGAVCMNAGAYGGEMKDIVTRVEVMDLHGNIKVLTNEEMNFGYRRSILQNGNLIATKVELQLKEGNYREIQDRMNVLNFLRKKKQPLFVPSAGSTFKRPNGYYAGELIEKAGLKGLRIRDAQVSELHAGFIVNVGNATARDVLELISEIQRRIKEKYGVELVPEVKILGEE